MTSLDSRTKSDVVGDRSVSVLARQVEVGAGRMVAVGVVESLQQQSQRDLLGTGQESLTEASVQARVLANGR